MTSLFVCFNPLQFAAEFTEKLLSQSVLARIAAAKRHNIPVNHSQILIEEILAVDEKFLTVAKSNEDMAGEKFLNFKVYLYPKILFDVKGTQFRSPLHQHSVRNVHQVMK